MTIGLWQMRTLENGIQYQAREAQNQNMSLENDIKLSLIEWFTESPVLRCIRDKHQSPLVIFVLSTLLTTILERLVLIYELVRIYF